MGHTCFKLNTTYYTLNAQLNEGGKYLTFSFMIFKPEYAFHAKHKGMIRLWFFGKEFVHWIKK